MGDAVGLGPKRGKKRGRGKTLCKRGFHKWVLDKEQRFDVKRGKLVTVVRCARYGIRRNELR